MLSIRRVQPVMRVLALMMICALALVWTGMISQRCNAISGEILLGYTAAAAAGSFAPVAIAGMVILALGVVFQNRDKLILAGAHLYEAISDKFDRDMADSKVLYDPVAAKYKLKTHISNDTWAAARTWVQSNYPVGDITDGASIVAVTDFASKTYVLPVGDTYTRYYMSDNWWYSYRIHYAVDGVNSSFQVFTVSDNGSETAGTLYSRAQHLAPIIDGMGSVVSIHDTVGANIFVSTDFASTRYKVLVPGDVVGLALPGYVDNPDCDFHNPDTDQRDVVLPLVPDVSGSPDVNVDGGLSVPEDAVDTLVGAVPTDATEADGAGQVVGTDVNVDSTPKTDAQTATDAAAADETQSSLAGLFFSKFPFCIPFDVLQAFKLIAVPAVAPYFEWDGLSTLPIEWHGSTKIVFDMGEERWQVVGQICRWTSLVGFCLALMLGTRRLMKW